ncbi:phenol hydroxylase [Corynebacterium diphtheriae]
MNDQWLDVQSRSRLSAFWHDSVTYPIMWSKKLLRFLATTPGKMTTLVVVLSVVLLSAGLSMAQSSAQRHADLNTLIGHTEPVANIAQDLYSSLSLADTEASASFVRGTNDNYVEYIQKAALLVTQTDGDIANIATQLPVYTGLVETARANNRQGHPVGVAYMSEASTLMQESILPAASQLYMQAAQEVSTAQRNLARPQIPLIGLVVALVLLVVGQIWLAHVTRRRFNAWFLLATVLMLVSTAWVGTTNWLNYRAGSVAYEQAAEPLELLTEARIHAQRARTDETLALVWRQSLENSNHTFSTTLKRVDKALSKPGLDPAEVAAARNAMNTWRASHEELTNFLNSGRYEEALKLTTEGPSAFTDLDAALDSLIDSTRVRLRAEIRGVDTTQVNVVIGLTIAAVLALWLGIRPRLQEYL